MFQCESDQNITFPGLAVTWEFKHTFSTLNFSPSSHCVSVSRPKLTSLQWRTPTERLESTDSTLEWKTWYLSQRLRRSSPWWQSELHTLNRETHCGYISTFMLRENEVFLFLSRLSHDKLNQSVLHVGLKTLELNCFLIEELDLSSVLTGVFVQFTFFTAAKFMRTSWWT